MSRIVQERRCTKGLLKGARGVERRESIETFGRLRGAKGFIKRFMKGLRATKGLKSLREVSKVPKN